MDFLSLLGIFKDGITFIAEKLRGPKEEFDGFLSGIKKTVKAARKMYIDYCKKSHEGLQFEYLDDSWVDEEIYNNVVSALTENRPFTIDQMLPKEKELPDVERTLLYKCVNACLKKSLEYCIRDYSAWSKQEDLELEVDVLEVKKAIDRMEKIISEIQTSIVALPKGWQAQPITYRWIMQRKKETLLHREEYERAYYKVTDHFPTLSGVICADLDCPNAEAIQMAKEMLFQSSRHLFIVGNGGEGKTSLLFRLAVELAKEGQICFWFRLSDCMKNSMDVDYAKRLLEAINKQAQELDTVAYLFVDNLFQGRIMLDALREVWTYEYSIRLITTERTTYMFNLLSPNNNQMQIWADEAECLCFHTEAEIQELGWKQPSKAMPTSLEWKMQIVDRMINTAYDLDQERLANAKERAEYNATDDVLTLVELMFSVFTEYNNSIFGERMQFGKKIPMDWDVWDQQIGQKFPDAYDSFLCIASLYRIGMPVTVTDFINYYGLKGNLFLDYVNRHFRNELKSPVIIESNEKGELLILPKHDMIVDLFFNFQEKTNTFKNFIGTWIQAMPEDIKKADVSTALADWYYNSHDFDQAEEQYINAISISEKTYGIDSSFVAKVYNNLGAVNQFKGDYVKALEWYGKSLLIREKVGEEDPDIGSIYNNIGYTYKAQGDNAKALDWLKRALSIAEKMSVKDYTVIVPIYNNIALVYKAKGDYTEALEWYKKSLDIREKMFSNDHSGIARTYNNMAGVFSAQGDYDKALEWYKKALVINEKVLGKEHLETANTYSNLGLVYEEQGDYEKALKLNEKALAIRLKVFGKEHPDIGMSYNNIAIIYEDRGDYEKALELNEKALAIREKALGKEHPDTGMSYNNIAGIYQKQGDDAKALEWYSKALANHEKVLGKEHPETGITYNNIAGIYHNRGDLTNALLWYGKSLAIYEKVLGKEHPYTGTAYNNIAGVYNDQGNYAKALECFRKALDISEKVLGKEHPDTGMVYNNLAAFYNNQGEFVKALEWYAESYVVMKNKFGAGHSDTIAIKKNVTHTIFEAMSLGLIGVEYMIWLRQKFDFK